MKQMFLSTACLLLAAASASGQLMVNYEKAGEPVKLQVLALRPNVAQPVYLHYQNPAPGVKRNVKITLEQFDAEGNAREIASTVLPAVKHKEIVPVKFAGPAPAKDAKDDVWPMLAGPPFQLRFRVEENKTDTPSAAVPIVLQEPRSYVKVTEARYDAGKKRLSIKLRWDEPLDPPCPVELDLDPSVIPGLKPVQAGTIKRTLSRDARQVELSAENIEFAGGVVPANGRIYVTVDGYRRAFLFKCTFSDGNLIPLKDDMRARLVAGRYALPGPKTPVRLEVDPKGFEEGDDDSPQKALVELKFDRVGDGTYENVPGSPFRGLREQVVEYKLDPEALLLRTKVVDRFVLLNTEGINGKRALQVRLLTAKGAPIPLADEQDERTERIALYNAGPDNPFAPLRFLRDKDLVVAEFVLDGSPPEEVRFEDLPPKLAPEGKFRPAVRVKERTLDQAPIGKVVFFAGKFKKEGALSEEGLIEANFDKAKKMWVSKDDFLVPPDLRGKIEISVRVSTSVGKTADKTDSIPIEIDKGPAAAGKTLATLTGKVLRGGLAIPGAMVFLVKAKFNKDDPPPPSAKTNDEGQFVFRDVEPGNYIVVSSRSDGTVGRLPVAVPKQKEKIDGLEVSLTAK